MSNVYLSILCSPEIEEKLLDLFLMSSESIVFTSTPIAAHGLLSSQLSQAEQVLGRAHATQVQAIVSDDYLATLLNSIKQQFAGTGLRYWTTAVLNAGEIV